MIGGSSVMRNGYDLPETKQRPLLYNCVGRTPVASVPPCITKLKENTVIILDSDSEDEKERTSQKMPPVRLSNGTRDNVPAKEHPTDKKQISRIPLPQKIPAPKRLRTYERSARRIEPLDTTTRKPIAELLYPELRKHFVQRLGVEMTSSPGITGDRTLQPSARMKNSPLKRGSDLLSEGTVRPFRTSTAPVPDSTDSNNITTIRLKIASETEEQNPSRGKDRRTTKPLVFPRIQESETPDIVDIDKETVAFAGEVLKLVKPSNVKFTPRRFPHRKYADSNNQKDEIIEISSDDEELKVEETATSENLGQSETKPTDRSSCEFFNALGLVSRTGDNPSKKKVFKREVAAVLGSGRNIVRYVLQPAVPLLKAGCIHKYALEKKIIKTPLFRSSEATRKKSSRTAKSSEKPGKRKGISGKATKKTSGPISTKAIQKKTLFLKNLAVFEKAGIWSSMSSPSVKAKMRSPYILIKLEDNAQVAPENYTPTERFCTLCPFSSLNVFTLERHLHEDHQISGL